MFLILKLLSLNIQMAPKVHPQILSSPSPSSSTSPSPYIAPERESFTVWLKSLVYQGNGCTVYDSKGRIVYRVDNYDKKCSKEVYLMDMRGKVLFSVQQQKKLRVVGQWCGYKWSDCGSETQLCFKVKKDGIFKGDMNSRILFECDTNKFRGGSKYKIVRVDEKLAFKIVDEEGRLVAEVKPKQSSCGVSLGEDVLSLMVEPEVDHSLIMAIVTAYGSMNQRL